MDLRRRSRTAALSLFHHVHQGAEDPFVRFDLRAVTQISDVSFDVLYLVVPPTDSVYGCFFIKCFCQGFLTETIFVFVYASSMW